MVPDTETKQKVSKEEFDIISNRLAVALAKRESLIKSWTASSSRKESSKTQEQLDAEDAALFRNQPAYLGVGAPIPAHFLVSDADQNNKSLRAKFFPSKGLKASKARDAEEKAASAKRALQDVDSDEEPGRSALGRAKKLKSKPRIAPIVKDKAQQVSEEVQSRTESHKAPKSSEDLSEPTKELQPSEMKQGNVVSLVDDVSLVADAAEGTKMVDGLQPQITSSHKMDPLERKRMKKREKKKRAKLRATIAT
jgi:hypothetical protein